MEAVLALLDGQIAAARTRLEELERCRATLAGLPKPADAYAVEPTLKAPADAPTYTVTPRPEAALPPEEQPGKPEPRPTREGSGEIKGRAAQVLALLAAKGPMRTGEIAAALGVKPENTAPCLKDNPHLFVKKGNQQSPWELTEAGRAAAAGSAATSAN